MGYLLYADFPVSGKIMRQASIPLIKGSKYLFEINAVAGREYTVGLTGVNKAGVESDIASAKVFVSGNSVTVPQKVVTSRMKTKPGKVVIQWEYRATPNLRGFRLNSGGKLAANEKILDGSVRKWTVKDVPTQVGQVFYLRAVSKSGRTSTAARVSVGPVAGPSDRPRRPMGLALGHGGFIDAGGAHSRDE